MQTITHPDQIAQMREQETDEPMFPKGVKQMLGFIYSMEGKIYGQASWHARMIILRESFDRGYVRPFPMHKINMKGRSPIEVNGECAGLRQQVQDMLEGDERHAVLAKFGRDDMEYTAKGVESLVDGLRIHLSNGPRRAQRSSDYCKDLIWHGCCSLAMYEKKYNVMAITRRNGGMSQSTVSRDAEGAKWFISRFLLRAYRKIEGKFSDGVVLP